MAAARSQPVALLQSLVCLVWQQKEEGDCGSSGHDQQSRSQVLFDRFNDFVELDEIAIRPKREFVNHPGTKQQWGKGICDPNLKRNPYRDIKNPFEP